MKIWFSRVLLVVAMIACLGLVAGCKKKTEKKGGGVGERAKVTAEECAKKHSRADGKPDCEKCCKGVPDSKGYKHVGGSSASCKCYIVGKGFQPK